MTTAARPTYYAAIGKADNGGFQSRMFSARDQVSHTKLKYRQVGQASVEEMKARDLKAEILKKEDEILTQNDKAMTRILEEEKKIDVTLLLKNRAEVDEEELKKFDDEDADVVNSDDDFDSSR